MNASELRKKILSTQDRKIEKVHVPIWNLDVWVRSLSGKERDHLEDMMIIENEAGKNEYNNDNARAKLLSMAICDENGAKVFSEADIAALGEKNAMALQVLWKVASRLSGITEDDVKELVEGIQASPFDSSATNSVNTSEA